MESLGNCPWHCAIPLRKWSIVGMNHYFKGGERCLFVAMTKDGRCIKAEGPDDARIWLDLVKQAERIDTP